MAYSTIDDLKLLMGEKDLLQCVDDEKLQTFVGHTAALERINKVIEWVDAEIDANARGGGYVVPLEDAALANSLSTTLAMERLIAGRRGLSTPARDAMFKQARERLASLTKGTLAPSDATSAPKGEVQGAERIFTRETLDRF